MTKRAVTNSTCLIALEGIGRLDLLPAVYEEVLAPPAVQAEFGTEIEWLVIKELSNPLASKNLTREAASLLFAFAVSF